MPAAGAIDGPVLRVRLEAKAFAGHPVLGAISLDLGADEFVALTGPSGCGKTTLLNIIAGLDRAYTGAVRFPAHHGDSPPRIGYVFQNPRLLPWKTVAENLHLVLPPGPGWRDKVAAVLDAVGLAGSANAYPGRLSLGMARRVALARALLVDPDLLILDEPFVSLDEPTAAGLRALLVRLLDSRPTAVLFVTHDLAEAAILADRVLVLCGRPARLSLEVPVEGARARRPADAVEATLVCLRGALNGTV